MDTQTQGGTAPEASPKAPAASSAISDGVDIAKNKDIAAFSYLWVMSVVIYVIRRDSPFVRYHSKQAMLLFVLSIGVWFIPFIGRLLELVVFGGMVMGFSAAAQGLRKDVPVVGPLSRGEISVRQAWKQVVEAIAEATRALRDALHKTPAAPKAPPTPPPPTPPSEPHTPADPPSSL